MFDFLKNPHRPFKEVTASLKTLKKPTFEFNTMLIGCALLGIVGCVYLIIRSGWHVPAALPVVQPPKTPFSLFIATSGIIESSTDNIQLSTNVAGVVDKVFVNVGESVKKGKPLFKLDTRALEAEVRLKQAQLEQTKANLKTSKDKFDLAKRIKDKDAISQDDFLARKNAYLTDKAALEVSQKTLESAKVNLDLLTVRAPLDCTILQVNVHPGELASQSPLTGDYIASPANTPLMLLGTMRPMHIRVDIDENQAWRFIKNTEAIAFLRGNSKIRLPLSFERIEPYVVPKTSLTGLSSERVDTRVLQVIYRFDPKDLPLYVGQQVDAFIEVPKDHEDKYAPFSPSHDADHNGSVKHDDTSKNDSVLKQVGTSKGASS